MRRVPLTFRALVLLPLLAVLTDQTRAAVHVRPARGELPRGGRPGLVRRGRAARVRALRRRAGARRRPAAPAPPPASAACGRSRTGAVWASCAAQAGVASLLGAGTAIGGGWLGLLALGVLAGAVLALALRVAPKLIQALRPSAPRLHLLRRGRLATARALVDGHERRPAAPDARSRPSGARLAPYAGPPPAARSALSATSLLICSRRSPMSSSTLTKRELREQRRAERQAAEAAEAAARPAPPPALAARRRRRARPRGRRRRGRRLVVRRHAQDRRARQVDAVRRHPRAQRRARQPEGAGDRHRVPRPAVPDLRRGVEDARCRRWSTTTSAPAR